MVEASLVIDAMADFSLDEKVPRQGTFKEYKDIADVDLNFSDNIILKDLESYLDDLNASLFLIRMVNQSVITSVIQEVNEKMAVKNAQVAFLTNKLEFKLHAAENISDSLPVDIVHEGEFSSLDLCMEGPHLEQLCESSKVLRDLLQRCKNEIACLNCIFLSKLNSDLAPECVELCSGRNYLIPENLIHMGKTIDSIRSLQEAICKQTGDFVNIFNQLLFDHAWACCFQRDVVAIVIGHLVNSFCEEFKTKFSDFEDRRTFNHHYRNYPSTLNDLPNLHRELGSVYESDLSSEPGHVITEKGNENFEESKNNSGKDYHSHRASENSTSEEDLMLNISDALPDFKISHLYQMTKEDLVIYYETEMNKMRRHHALALQQKSEELLVVQRELFKEAGSMLHNKGRDSEKLRKILSDPSLDFEMTYAGIQRHGLEEDKLGECLHVKEYLSYLLCENQHLRDLLSEERLEVNNILSHNISSKTSHHSLGEQFRADSSNRIASGTDALDNNDHHYTIGGSTADKAMYNKEISKLEIKSIHEVYAAVFGGYFQDCSELMGAITMKHSELKRSLEDNLLEKDKALKSGTDKIDILMQEIETLSKLLMKKEKAVEEAELALDLKSKHFDAVCEEMNILRDRESNQAEVISEHKNAIYVLNSKLQMGTKQIQQYTEKISQLDENLNIVVRELNETKKHQNILHDVIKEREVVFTTSKAVQTEEVRSMILSLLQLLKAFEILESNVMESIRRNNTRLGNLKNLVNQRAQFADRLQEKLLWYKQNLEMKSSNLQKAETEVDLLGDEVDLLLDSLAKIYFALDHYSPVLQHYPAVMDILKLIKRVLNRSPKSS